MANRYATKNGNWSDVTVWDGGTLPGATDDVWANGFDVTIDQNITVASLRNDDTNGMTAASNKEFIIGASVTINANLDYGSVTGASTLYTILSGSNLPGITVVINGDIIEAPPAYTGVNADAISLTSLQDTHVTFNGDIYLKRNASSCLAISVIGTSGTAATFIHNGDILVRDPNSTDGVSGAISVSGQDIDYTFTGTIENIDVAIGSSANTFHLTNQFSTNIIDVGTANITGFLVTAANRIYSAAEGQTTTVTANEIIGKGGDYAVELGTGSTCDAMNSTVNADIKSDGGKGLYVTGEVNCNFTLNGDVYRSTVSTTSKSVTTLYVAKAETTINGDIKAGGYGVGATFNQSDINRVINGMVYGESDGITGAIAVNDAANHSGSNRLTIDTVDLTNTITTEHVVDGNSLNTSTNTNAPLIKNVVGIAGLTNWVYTNYLCDPNGSYTLADGNGGVTTFSSGSAGVQPPESKVLSGTSYGVGKTGLLDLPVEATVLKDIVYGESGAAKTGTLETGGGIGLG